MQETNVTGIGEYAARRCLHCGKPMQGIRRIEAADRGYCGPKCAVAGQRDKVILAAGKDGGTA